MEQSKDLRFGFNEPTQAGMFVELAKFKIVDLWVGVLVGWSLLPSALRFDARSLGLLGLSWLATLAFAGATCSLDDVTGLRDGVDAENHGDGPRFGVNKPLLDGRLGEDRAMRFAKILIAMGTLATLLALVAANAPPWWLGPFMAFVFATALNYSYWLKLSYLGGGELVMLIAASGTVLMPFVLVTSGLTLCAVVQALLIGLWLVQVIVCSNSQDADGDRATGRMTLAAMLSPRGNRIYITAVFALGYALPIVAFKRDVLALPQLLYLLPAFVLQLGQLWSGAARGEWLKARWLGFWAFRFGFAGLLLSNLIA